MKNFKIVALAFAGSLLVVLAIFCWRVSIKDSQNEKMYEKWQEERRNLEIEHRAIETKLEKLDEDFYAIATPKATSQIIFTDLDSRVYTQAYPLLDKKEYVGMLVFSEKNFPGEKGCITKKQYEELIKKGWSICVQWEEPEDAKTWWKDWEKKIKKLGNQSCEGVYCPKGTYDEKLDSILEELNFGYVIIEKEDKESPLQTGTKEDLWHIGAMGSMTSQPKKWLKEAVVQRANVGYLVSFSIENQIFEEETFGRMLSSFEEMVIAEELSILNVEQMTDYRENYLSYVDSNLSEKYFGERSELEKKLEEVQNKLDKIDEEYQ